jgi:hypothetical protein
MKTLGTGWLHAPLTLPLDGGQWPAPVSTGLSICVYSLPLPEIEPQYYSPQSITVVNWRSCPDESNPSVQQVRTEQSEGECTHTSTFMSATTQVAELLSHINKPAFGQWPAVIVLLRRDPTVYMYV